uniref:CS domain-containing protein n=1 Tax=Oryctolagus cuniculus TaxID=9986 RepID=A0A5F9C141_RABIT
MPLHKAELDNEKPAAVVAPITTGYTVKISNYGWDQSDKFVKIYITLPGVHHVPTESVQVKGNEFSISYCRICLNKMCLLNASSPAEGKA